MNTDKNEVTGEGNAPREDESVKAGFKSAFQYDLETKQLQAELDTLASAKKDFAKTGARNAERKPVRVIETAVYNFDDLDGSAQEKAREWYRVAMRLALCDAAMPQCLLSDDSVDEMIRANEYTFTESGERKG